MSQVHDQQCGLQRNLPDAFVRVKKFANLDRKPHGRSMSPFSDGEDVVDDGSVQAVGRHDADSMYSGSQLVAEDAIMSEALELLDETPNDFYQ